MVGWIDGCNCNFFQYFNRNSSIFTHFGFWWTAEVIRDREMFLYMSFYCCAPFNQLIAFVWNKFPFVICFVMMFEGFIQLNNKCRIKWTQNNNYYNNSIWVQREVKQKNWTEKTQVNQTNNNSQKSLIRVYNWP